MSHALKTVKTEDVTQRSWRITARRMMWITWRQHRSMLTGMLVVLSGLAVIMLLVGLRAHAQFATLPQCSGGGKCAMQPDMFNQRPYDSYPTIIGFALHVIPLLIGVFLGAPLLAAEFEAGSLRFTWTQGTTRIQWTVAKLLLLAVPIALATAALGVLAEWSWQPFAWLGMFNTWQSTLFDVSATNLAGWALFAFAFGALAGAVTKRTVPSMAITMASIALFVGTAWWKIDNLFLGAATAKTHSAPYVTGNLPGVLNQPAPSGSGPLNGSWLVRGWFTGPDGKPLSTAAMRFLNMRMPGNSAASQMQWLASHHETYWVAYQPANRLWAFQGMYTGVLLLLAIASGAATIWLVHRATV
jgi:hypothetical protein